MPFIFLLAALLCLASVSWAKTKADKLAAKRYVDPKGFFRIVPPEGWRVQEYPQDLRGKVAFIAPEPNVDLRVLVKAVDFSNTDELVSFCKSVEARTGLSTNIKRAEFYGRPTVKRSFKMEGIKFFTIDFLVGSVYHNIQYGAPPNVYQKYLPLVTKSIETYEAIGRIVSDKELFQYGIAKKFRLAQLMMENGSYDLALDYIKEALEMSPQDTKLLELKKKIESKRGRP
jgi:tetratricopeptide (TPR) repeat protein